MMMHNGINYIYCGILAFVFLIFCIYFIKDIFLYYQYNKEYKKINKELEESLKNMCKFGIKYINNLIKKKENKLNNKE